MSSYLSFDGVRVALVLVLAIGQALMAYWPDLRRWPHTVARRSAAQRTQIVPIPWAFAIWGLIFFGCMAFAIWQALPGNLSDPLLGTLGWLAAAAFAINIAWEYHVPTRDIDATSVVLIALALVALLAIMAVLERAEPVSSDTALFSAPLRLLAGWITAATFVNLSSTLRLNGIPPSDRLNLTLLLGAVLLGGGVALATGAVVYAAAIAWALFGIVMANRQADASRTIRFAALGAMPLPIVAALVGG